MMKTLHLLFIVAFSIAVFSCKTANKLNAGSYGGRFDGNKSSKTIQVETKNNAQTDTSFLSETSCIVAEKKIVLSATRIESFVKENMNYKPYFRLQTKAENEPPVKSLPIEPNAKYSFWLSILSFLSLGILFIYLATLPSLPAIGKIAIVSFIICQAYAMALGIKSIKIQKANPGKYRGRAKAMVGIWFFANFIGVILSILFTDALLTI